MPRRYCTYGRPSCVCVCVCVSCTVSLRFLHFTITARFRSPFSPLHCSSPASRTPLVPRPNDSRWTAIGWTRFADTTVRPSSRTYTCADIISRMFCVLLRLSIRHITWEYNVCGRQYNYINIFALLDVK